MLMPAILMGGFMASAISTGWEGSKSSLPHHNFLGQAILQVEK